MNNDGKNIFLAVLLIVAIVFSFFTIYVSSYNSTTLSARSAVLYEPETKTYLYEKNSSERLPMASTTKIMTALVALDKGDCDDIFTVPKEAIGTEGSSAYFQEGERLTLEGLIYSLLLQSANDAAVAIAYGISGGTEEFAYLMNNKARELMLTDTRFSNPHGLDDDDHYTTARDLAVIADAALKNSTIKKIVSTYKKTVSTDRCERTFVNHNKLLRIYEGATGVKTGFTRKCGRCLVGSAEKDGLSLISVTLNAPDDWNDHIKLFDLGFTNYEKRFVVNKDEYRFILPVINGTKNEVKTSNVKDYSFIGRKDESNFDKYLALSKFAIAPIKKGDIVGTVIISKDGTVIKRIDIISLEDIPDAKKDNFFIRFMNNILKFF